jgi:serpin B
MQSSVFRTVVAAMVSCFSTAALADTRSIETLVSEPAPGPIRLLPAGGSGSEQGNLIPPHARAPLSADARELVAGNNRFAIDLYRRLAVEQNASQNMLASPLSISAALGMTYAGASGRTAEQMADVLRFTLPDDQLHAAFGEVIRDLDATREGYQLSIANRLFGQQGFDFDPSFMETTRRDYDAPLERLDFAHDPDGSREHINSWVEEQTNDKIQELLPVGSIEENTRLVLTNAIYFNGKWKYKFDEELTHHAPFHQSDGGATAAATMFQQNQFRYGAFAGFQALEMPYAGDDLSMVLLLPDTRDGLASLEASLTAEMLDSSLDAMWEREVQVYLPKFKFDASFKLGGTLQDMQMTDPFDPELSDLTGIAQPADGNLYVADVLHKAFIDVNEAGTEAAAATAVVVGITTCLCGPPQPAVFRADHPFLFALRDRHSGSLMFMGRVTEPGESKILGLAQSATPEPSSILLMIAGTAIMCRVRRRSRS